MSRLSKSYQAVYKSVLESKRINSVSDAAEALYFRLLCASDDYGRYHGDAFRVCAQALMVRWQAGSVTPAQVEARLVELEQAGSIRRYEVASERFLEIVDYSDPTSNQRRVEKFPSPSGASVAPAGAIVAPIRASVAPAGDSEAPVVPLRARAGSPTPTPTQRESAREVPAEPEPDPGPGDPPRFSGFVDAMTLRLISRAPGGGGLDGKRQWPIGDRVSQAVELVHRLYPDRHEDAESALGRMFEAKLADHDPLNKKAITHLHCWLMGESGSDLLPTLSHGLQQGARA